MSEELSEQMEVFFRLLAERERKLGIYAMLQLPHVHAADEIPN